MPNHFYLVDPGAWTRSLSRATTFGTTALQAGDIAVVPSAPQIEMKPDVVAPLTITAASLTGAPTVNISGATTGCSFALPAAPFTGVLFATATLTGGSAPAPYFALQHSPTIPAGTPFDSAHYYWDGTKDITKQASWTATAPYGAWGTPAVSRCPTGGTEYYAGGAAQVTHGDALRVAFPGSAAALAANWAGRTLTVHISMFVADTIRKAESHTRKSSFWVKDSAGIANDAVKTTTAGVVAAAYREFPKGDGAFKWDNSTSNWRVQAGRGAYYGGPTASGPGCENGWYPV